MSFKIVVDSCCELTPQMKKDPCFVRVPLTIQSNGSTFVDDDTFDQADLLWAMKQSSDAPVTSCPSPLAYLDAFAGGAEARVLNAPGEFQNLPIEVFDFGLDVNLKGAVYFAHAALKYMAEQNCGVIVFIGSITGEEGSPNNVAYAASKSALMNGVVKSIAQAGAKYNVRSVCVAPGPVLTRAAMANMKTMAGRAAEPQEIVDMIMYLASEKGAFVNGTTLLMDGGRNVMYNKG